MDNIEVITRITFLFFIYLILALFIERLVEVAMSVYNYIEMKSKLRDFWNRKAKSYQKRFDRLYSYHGPNVPKTEQLLNWVLWKVISDKPYPGGKEIISAQLIRLNYIRIASRTISFVTSLIFAILLKVNLEIDLLSIIEKILEGDKIIGTLAKSDFLGVVLTAVAISLGSEPMHQVISRVEKIGERRRAKAKGGA